MNEPALQLADWVYQNYGRTGCGAVLLLTLAVLALIFYLVSRLPEQQTAVWPKCQSCRYRRKESNVFVLACPKHETPRWNQFRFPACSCQDDF